MRIFSLDSDGPADPVDGRGHAGHQEGVMETLQAAPEEIARRPGVRETPVDEDLGDRARDAHLLGQGIGLGPRWGNDPDIIAHGTSI